LDYFGWISNTEIVIDKSLYVTTSTSSWLDWLNWLQWLSVYQKNQMNQNNPAR
jgi:hypothetical protein